MNDRKSPNRRKISSKEVRELLADTQWTEDETMSKLFHGKVYTHPDGRVLNVLTLGNSRPIARLYSRRDEFESLLQALEENQKFQAKHILQDRLPQGQDFVSRVPELINELAVILRIPRRDLNGSLDSLSRVDAKLKRIGREQSLQPPTFPALVAYVGEVMKQTTKGDWEMRLSEDGDTWEPWIVDPHGRSCSPFLAVYDELAEQHPFSIQGATSGRIVSRRMQPQNKSNSTAILYKRRKSGE
jgi:hypothetical protein